MKIIFNILKKRVTLSKGNGNFSLLIYKKPEANVNGITSRTESGNHILLADYDNCLREIVEQEAVNIQKKYNTVPALLFSTKEETSIDNQKYGNYHLIFLQKFSMKKVYEIQEKMSIDPRYKKLWLSSIYKSQVLRFTSKGKKERPKFLKIIGDMANLDKPVSNAHYIFLRKLYPKIPKIDFKNLDKSETTYITNFDTANV